MKIMNSKGVILVLGMALLGGSCAQHSAGSNSMMNSPLLSQDPMTNSNHGNMMNHNGMKLNSDMPKLMEMKSSPDAAKQPYDSQFLDTMTHHHQGAVEMAKTVLLKSRNEELRGFAQNVIDDQTFEILKMKDWREKWFAGIPPALNMEMPGMMDSMKMMTGDGMKMTDGMSGKAFDNHFLTQMIEHHKGAVAMSKDALKKSAKPEVKELAKQIIEAQEVEILMMKDWESRWSR